MSALASLERFGEEDPFFINTVYKVQTNEYLSILSSKWNFIIAELEILQKNQISAIRSCNKDPSPQ